MASTHAVSQGWKILMMDMGLVPERVLRRAGLPTDLLSRGQTRITSAQYFALWEALEIEASGMEIPLLLAEHLSVESFEPPLFAATCCPTLKAAAQRIAQYKPLIGPMRLSVDDRGHSVALSFTWPGELRPPTALGYTELLFWVSLARLCTRAPVQPTAVTATTLPANMASYRAYLGIDITEGPRWSVSFSQLDATRPFLTGNEGMWRFFEPELRQRLAQLEEGATITERATVVLLELLPTSEVTAEAVARKLAMSKRTLQRRLSEDGTRFLDLLARTRETLARHYLHQSQLPTAEISFLLGYADPNSFYRAFHAWTGSTPETLRASAVGGKSGPS